MISSPRHDLVDRAIDLFPAPTDARERLTRRRARQQRKRRLAAGAVGIAVALAAAAALGHLIDSGQVPADRPLPPPGVSGALAYALDGDIYVADPDASNAARIAAPDEQCEGSVESSMPSWSPDGMYLAFQRGCLSSGPSAVVISAAVVISDPAGNVVAEFPMDVSGEFSWSPDSTRVAIWETFGQEIGVYGVDGARQVSLPSPLTEDKASSSGLRWLHDGSALLVPGLTPSMSVVLPLDGSPAHDFSGELPDITGLSPDGTRNASLNRQGELIVRDVASGKATVLTDATSALPQGALLNTVRGFSPQGDRILYAALVRGDEGGIFNNLYSIGVDGSDPRLLVVGAMQGQWRPR